MKSKYALFFYSNSFTHSPIESLSFKQKCHDMVRVSDEKVVQKHGVSHCQICISREREYSMRIRVKKKFFLCEQNL